MSKYDPLRHYLTGRAQGRWMANFADIQDILGTRLPPSAFKHQAWWANETNPRAAQKCALSQAGWRTTDLDLERLRITFVRD